jgi:hypothetical protein
VFVTDELPEARAELAALRVEVAAKRGRERLLLRFGVSAELLVQVIAGEAIRPTLEGFMRVARPAQFPPGSLFGPFLGACE